MKFRDLVATRNTALVVLPRNNGNVVFKIQAVMEPSKFVELVPYPKAPLQTSKGGVQTMLFDDPEYKNKFGEWLKLQNNWFIIEGIRDTEGLSFDKVVLDDVSTYHLLDEEFSTAFITEAEKKYLSGEIERISGLNEGSLEEARANFLRSQTQAT